MLLIIIFNLACACFAQTTSYNTLTLRHGKEITCLAPVEDAIYIHPPVGQSGLVEDAISYDSWKDDDWLKLSAIYSNCAAVFDKRWQNFDTIYGRALEFNINFALCVSFSVYDTNKIDFIIMELERRNEHFIVAPQNETLWTHFTILVKNNHFFVFENNHVIQNITLNLSPTKIIVRAANFTYWKKHNYILRFSDIPNQKPSSLTIPPTNKSCLLIYTAMCKDCLLGLVFSNADNRTTMITDMNTNNNQTELMLWQQHRFDIDLKNGVNVSFKRIRNGTYIKGQFWALDVRICPDLESGLVKYSYKLPSESSKSAEYTCYNLNITKNEINSSNNDNPLSCEPGKLGKSCNISCGVILGEELKFCQGCRICVNNVCSCSWGFEGPLCQDSCVSGKWGPSCNNNCSAECYICNSRDGTCTEQELITTIVLSLLLILVIVFLVGVVYCIKQSRRRKQANVDNEEEEKLDYNSRVAICET